MAAKAKPSIIIERPEGDIPGLLDVNSVLAERFGVAIVVTAEYSKWIGVNLHHAHIEKHKNEEIIVVGEVLH